MTVKRNDPCPCGSGKKYKACCLEKDKLHNQERVNSNLDASPTLQEAEIYNKLGIRERQANRYYVAHLVQFFKESKEDKRQALGQSLSLFVDYLEHERATTWEACDENFWTKLFAFSQLDLSYEQSGAKTKAFFEDMVAFTKWLDAQGDGGNMGKIVAPLVSQLEEPVLQSVRFLEEYHENIENPFLTGYGELRRETLIQEAGDIPTTEGVFEVVGREDEGVVCQSLLTRLTYCVNLPKEIREAASSGTTFIGLIKEVAPAKWEILALDRVFPPEARNYLRQAIGVQR